MAPSSFKLDKHFELRHVFLTISVEASTTATISVTSCRKGRDIDSLDSTLREIFNPINIAAKVNVGHVRQIIGCHFLELVTNTSSDRFEKTLQGRPFKQTRKQDIKYHEAAIKISIDELESLINVSVSKNGASIRSQQSVVQKLEKKVYCHTYSASL